jgi:hypothetical protein
MKVIMGTKKYKLKNSHPLAQAIIVLAQAYPASTGSVPERNDVKQLWRDLNANHRELLTEIAKRPTGISQSDLQTALGTDWQGIRGVHNGLARICEGLGFEKPVRVVGYNSTNRRYLMDPDVAATVQKLSS